MRRLVEDREFAARIGARAASDIRKKLSPHIAADHIIRRLHTLISRSFASSGLIDEQRSVLREGDI
jgi:hypothetical protein